MNECQATWECTIRSVPHRRAECQRRKAYIRTLEGHAGPITAVPSMLILMLVLVFGQQPCHFILFYFLVSHANLILSSANPRFNPKQLRDFYTHLSKLNSQNVLNLFLIYANFIEWWPERGCSLKVHSTAKLRGEFKSGSICWYH